MISFALAIFFHYFLETLPGGFSYEEGNGTITIYKAYQSEMRSYPADAVDTSIAVSAAVIQNQIDRQLGVLFALAGLLQTLFILLISKKRMFSRYYFEMSGKVLFWFALAALTAALIFLSYIFTTYTADIQNWIDTTDTYLEEQMNE